ncbi:MULTISPECIES: DNA-binding protein [Stenotrophomonas]|uniref:DNA-binding protein n=1 Tax=Stenotrophomonas TaxID=40323 RepID=UPI000C9E74AD|nr:MULTISPECIES: DNA-binding protein [Stenotrophomonas]MCM2523598.1 DNA-binding protein [Stenotrophomonas maltophilia]MCU1126930.1 DNA-binding protein [Stenotrophomonas maltophilia]UQY96690.1 DNA-binding protein [Stenotrophomonas maltophilia]UXB18182.1 DNA-binding protein [Stenotrophomonas maltophilia]UXB34350.1 DNA-binding protein [Stenotrophomonas maltophilia]
MARGGLYKSEIKKARDSLLAQGINPSLDAIRIALGNTGSKTTIHRYLKELEAEEGQGVGATVAVSDALQDLIGRLAARLHEEAETAITEAREQFQAQMREREAALESQRQEAAALSTQLQRTETALQAETEARAQGQQALTEANTTVRQLEERVAGLTTRVVEHEAHARSLEEKHQHARQALEHYRTSVKEQREQEQRRHEQQVQELQVALRQANEALTAKNHELLQLNRDNGQWLERHGRLERELAQAKHTAEAQQRELDALRLTATEHQALQTRWAEDVRTLDSVRIELTDARAETTRERERREQAEANALRAGVRQETLEQLLAQFRPEHANDSAADAISSREKAAP